MNPYLLPPIKPKTIEIPEIQDSDSIVQFYKKTLNDRTSYVLMHRPNDVNHTKTIDGLMNYSVNKLYDFIRCEVPRFQYKIEKTPYTTHSKFSKRKRKKKYVGEFRNFYNYRIFVSGYGRTSECAFSTHDIINCNIK